MAQLTSNNINCIFAHNSNNNKYLQSTLPHQQRQTQVRYIYEKVKAHTYQ